ncbi:MAG: tRNA lysidine(34) synthetase TilS [Clostridia bacterium]|nr:tRNA lysidine(34) synthetase TilS [Clostridia bacterium]
MQQIDTSKTYVLAVSGGVDSMVMLHMFATTHKSAKFSVVTINHNLRKEALSDCQFVQDFCQTLGVPCQTISVDVVGFCQQNKLSVETGARILRNQVFESLPCDFVCLAHHADDNAESVLMHLLRGSGANGVQGMQRQNGKYLRPMLCLGRQQIANYAKQHGVPHVEDSTNACNNHARNAIRNQVFPLLQGIYPGAKTNLLRFETPSSKTATFWTDLPTFRQYGSMATKRKSPLNCLFNHARWLFVCCKKCLQQWATRTTWKRCIWTTCWRLPKTMVAKKFVCPLGLLPSTTTTAFAFLKKMAGTSPCFPCLLPLEQHKPQLVWWTFPQAKRKGR